MKFPYLSFSGGEPMLHPQFFEMVERVCARGGQLKIETNGHYLTPENCERLRQLGVKAVQVSLDGASAATFGRMRVRGEFDRTLAGVRNLRAAGVPIEINFSPASFNVHEAEQIVDLAYELGAVSFYSGRTMFTGNAVKAWRHLALSDEQYDTFFDVLRTKGRAVPRKNARAFPRSRSARGVALPAAKPRGAADRASERAGEADQRAAVRVRRFSAPKLDGDLGQLQTRVAGSARREVHPGPGRRPRPDADAAPMGSCLSTSPLALPSAVHRLTRVLTLVRYRFFLFAGLLPYLLGAAWAYGVAGVFDAAMFWSGLGGVVFAVIGVEAYNEYFDARMGTDRVFNPQDVPPVTDAVFWIGTAAFAAALAVGVYLTARVGWPILAFALLGGAAAIFYEAPPIRWSYRGLGEAVIALAYGPWMVLGSLYLHSREISWSALLASLVPGLLIMALAVVNAIPDFHQDRLVGKRNLVVRLGRERAVWLYLALAASGLLVVAVGVALGAFPAACLAALLALPLLSPAADVRFALLRRRDNSCRRCATWSAAMSWRSAFLTGGILLHAWC